MFCVYILHSKKLNCYYIGFTSDLTIRLNFHEKSIKGKFTSKVDDWVVFLTIDCDSKQQAMDIEKHIKIMKSKKYIENLKKYPEIIEKLKIKYC